MPDPVVLADPPVDLAAGALAAMDAALVEPAASTGTELAVIDPPADPAADPAKPGTDLAVVDPAAPVVDPAAPGVDPAAAPVVADPAAPVVDPAAAPVADPAAVKRPSDEFGELPKDVRAETRERFDKMKGAYDTVSAERDQAIATARQWTETVASTGATGEQFGATLGYLQAVNEGTPEGYQRAWDMMLPEMQHLAQALGKDLPGLYDPLKDHADLREAIEDDKLTHAGALEIAEARHTKALRAAADKTASDRSTGDTVRQGALNSIAAFGAAERARDPVVYAAKMEVIGPAVKAVIARLPPAEWDAAIRELYVSTQVRPPAPEPAPVVVKGSIRPGGTIGAGGSLAKEPGSVLEAVDMALARR